MVFGPEKMITIPPRHYCVIENPAVKDDEEKPVYDDNGQIKLLHADQVIKICNYVYSGGPLFRALANW